MSSVCHAPLPARMEAFTTRVCLRAADQYERIVHSRFSKPSSRENSQLKKDANPQKENQQNRLNLGSYSAINAFRHWRKNGSMGDRSISAGSSIANFGCPSTDPFTNKKLEHFPLFSLSLSNSTIPDEDLSLKFLALNALDLTAPASDVLLKNRIKSWFQLSGHPDGFAPAGPGTVWKRRTGGPENTERGVYEAITEDPGMRDLVPRYYREVEYKGDTFIELQDLLFGFSEPHMIDIKMGTRTFLESEVSKTSARHDLYQKMIAVDPGAPTEQEHEQKAVTKLRYMQFREEQSSSCGHGFRVEGMKFPGSPPIKELQKIKSHQDVVRTLGLFLGGKREVKEKILKRLNAIRTRLEESSYFRTHEVIGSSIFMIYDSEKVGVWLIDFAKTNKVPDGQTLTHRAKWQQGNHEEGFLFGLDNLISTIEELDMT